MLAWPTPQPAPHARAGYTFHGRLCQATLSMCLQGSLRGGRSACKHSGFPASSCPVLATPGAHLSGAITLITPPLFPSKPAGMAQHKQSCAGCLPTLAFLPRPGPLLSLAPASAAPAASPTGGAGAPWVPECLCFLCLSSACSRAGTCSACKPESRAWMGCLSH